MHWTVGDISVSLGRKTPNILTQKGYSYFVAVKVHGKTLSAVQYVKKLCEEYPRAILVTNVDIKGLPATTAVIEYNRH